jgi:hypothetical protein
MVTIISQSLLQHIEEVRVKFYVLFYTGAPVAQLVEALRYKPAGRGLDFFHWHNPVGRTMALGSTQPLTEMSTRNISWWVNVVGAYG